MVSDLSKKFIKYDPKKPYAFVSYSSRDYEVVWEDVGYLQNLGFNIWIDYNLDGTEKSWKEALNIIEQPNCKFVLFYISKSSVTSLPCSEELEKANDLVTCRNHLNNNVPIVGIEINNIDNINSFYDEIEDELIKLEKEERKIKLNALYTIKKYFVEEKPRIKSKCYESRKSDYFDDIIKTISIVNLHNKNLTSYYFKSQKFLIDSYLNDYVDRKEEQKNFNSFVENNKSGYILLLGESEIGKTTFICNIIKKYQAIHHFVSSNENRNKKTLIIKSLIEQINSKMNETTPELTDNLDSLINLFCNLLQEYSDFLNQNNLKEIFVLDDVANIVSNDNDNLINFFPEILPSNVFVVLVGNQKALEKICPFFDLTITLFKLSNQQVNELIHYYELKKNKKYDLKSIEQMLEVCEGKPSQIVYFLNNLKENNLENLILEFKEKRLNIVNMSFKKWYGNENETYLKIIKMIEFLSLTYTGISKYDCRQFVNLQKFEYSIVENEIASYVFETDENGIRKYYLKDDRVKRYLNSPNFDYAFNDNEKKSLVQEIILYFEKNVENEYSKKYLIFHYYELCKYDEVIKYFNEDKAKSTSLQFLTFIFEGFNEKKLNDFFMELNKNYSFSSLQMIIEFLYTQIEYGNYHSVDFICNSIDTANLNEGQLNDFMYCKGVLLRKNKALKQARDIFAQLMNQSNEELKIKSAIQYANCLRELGNVKECMNVYYNICTNYNKTKYPHRYYDTILGINDRYYVNGTLKKALVSNQDAINNCKKLNYDSLLLKFYKMNSQIYRDMFDYKRGNEYFYEAYKVCKELKDYGRKGELLNLYCIQNAQDDTIQSLEWAYEALKINQNIKSSIETGKSYIAIALCQLYLGNCFEALNNIDSAIQIFSESNYKSGLGKAYHEKGKILMNFGDYNNSALCFEQSTRFFKREEMYSYPLYVIRNIIYLAIIKNKNYNVIDDVKNAMLNFDFDLEQTIELYDFMTLEDYIKKCIYLLPNDFSEIIKSITYENDNLINGINNFNYVKEINGLKLIGRISKNCKDFDLKILNEYDVLNFLNENEFYSCPQVLFYDFEQKSFLYKYIDGVTLFDKYGYNSIEDWHIRNIAFFFKKIHSLNHSQLKKPSEYKTNIEFYDFIKKSYLKIYKNLFFKYSEIFNKLGFPKDAQLDFEEENKIVQRDLVLCHCDCHRKNIIEFDHQLIFIDWELALIGDPYYDLAIHIQKMFYTQNEIDFFLNSYFNKNEIEDEKCQIQKYIKLETIKYAFTDLVRIIEADKENTNSMIKRYFLKLQNAYKIWNKDLNLSLDDLIKIIMYYRGGQ